MRLYPFPSPRLHLHLPQGKRASDMKHPERYWDFSTLLIRWMGRNGLRRLRQAELQGENLTLHDLASWFRDIVYDKGSQVIAEEKSRNSTSDEDIYVKSFEAAQFALDTYDPEFYERASRGGQKSRRSANHTVQDLLALPGDLSVAEQAEALGCSPRTVSSLRKLATGVLDADALLLAQLDAEIAAKGTHETSTPEGIHETNTPEGVHPMRPLHHEVTNTTHPMSTIPDPSPETLEAPVVSIPETKLELSPLPNFEAMLRQDEADRAARIPQDAFLDLMAEPDPTPEHTFTPWPTAEEDTSLDIDITGLFKDLLLQGAA